MASSSIERILRHLDDLSQLLLEPAAAPDPNRRGAWNGTLDQVIRITDDLRLAVVEALEPPVAATRTAVADAIGLAAATLRNGGRDDRFEEHLRFAGEHAGSRAQKQLFAAAAGDPDSFCLLARARWLAAHQRTAEAADLREQVRRDARHPAMRDAAERAVGDPWPSAMTRPVGEDAGPEPGRPVQRAPMLVRLNGIGTTVMGERDRSVDGSYVTTWWFTIFWVPVLPLGAFR